MASLFKLCKCSFWTVFLLVSVNALSSTRSSYRRSGSIDFSCQSESDDDPIANTKFLNESCNSTSECFTGTGPVICSKTDGVCQCALGFYAESIDSPSFIGSAPFFQRGQFSQAEVTGRYFCKPLPSLFLPCTSQCAPPLRCVGSNNVAESLGSSAASGSFSSDSSVREFDRFGQTNFGQFRRPNNGFVGGDLASFGIKTCRCLLPYKIINYKCELECQQDEFYADGECHKQCKDDQVQIGNFQCKQRVDLNAECEFDEQCSKAFSECRDKKCTCRAGFKNDGGSCAVRTASCEYGQPLRNGGDDSAPVSCVYKAPTVLPLDLGEIVTSDGLSVAWAHVVALSSGPNSPHAQIDANEEDDSNDDNDNQQNKNIKNICPLDHYCQPYEQPVIRRTAAGFCCPKKRAGVCPAGEPHPSANCTASISLASVAAVVTGSTFDLGRNNNDDDTDNACPRKTHYCYQVDQTTQAVCCPRACPNGAVLATTVENRCLPLASIGGKCLANEQCVGSSVCINGTCSCPNKTELVDNGTGRKFCTATCDPIAEVTFNNRCYARKKLGESCRGQEFRCPLIAYCSSTRGICECPCGMVRINDTLCAPPPICPTGPAISANINSNNLLDEFGEILQIGINDNLAGFGNRGRQRQTSQNQLFGRSDPRNRGTRFSAKQMLENTTVCRVSDHEPALDRAVDRCPDGQYCRAYLDNLGVCCPTPEPFCPDGAKPQNRCDPSNTGSSNTNTVCGPDSICFAYLLAANRNFTEGHVCCPQQRFVQFFPNQRVPFSV